MRGSDYISYQIAKETLGKRHGATPEEIAIWVFLGPEHGGLAAYDNNKPRPCSKAETCRSYDSRRCAGFQPARFSFGDLVGAEESKDDGNPLADCYFSKAAVEGFAPEQVGRFISGKALLERWRVLGFSDADIKAKVTGRIQNDELIDLHPVVGVCGFAGMGLSAPFEQAMFQLDRIEAIETRDFTQADAAKEKANPKRCAPAAFRKELDGLFVEFEKRAEDKKLTATRWCIPGTKKDLLGFAKQKKVVAQNLTQNTFNTYIKGLCNFKQHQEPVYNTLFPELSNKC